MERRVLVHAPRGRDAQVVETVLGGRGMAALICATQDDLLAGLRAGAAAAIVTEESLAVDHGSALETWLAAQPSWSDFPFIVLTTQHTKRRSAGAQASLRTLGNVVLLERPVNADTLASAAAAAARARDRQYATRQNLEELRQTRATVERLNLELEDRIEARTHALAAANDRLMREISERERAEAALLHMQKMEAIGQLTGGIAHDFNNLLHVVSMNLELLARQSRDAKTSALADRTRQAVARGSRLTSQLLAFARKQSLLPKLTDVNALLSGMHELVAISIGSSASLQLALSNVPAWAVLDAGQLEMAVLNLVVNAKDAMPDGGTITLATVVETAGAGGGPAGDGTADNVRNIDNDFIKITVADQGTGIPPQLLSKVFDPFFTTKAVGSGTGLGLSQVYGFAQQSGGSARIERSDASGTTVALWFPLVKPAAHAADAGHDAQTTGPENLKILVIEDDAEVRRVLVESLEISGHRVSSAADGMEGLDLLKRGRPDLLIVDYAMPHMNGAEVIEQTRKLHPDLPIILATGYADVAEVGRVLGTNSILTKPFDIAALLTAVEFATRAG